MSGRSPVKKVAFVPACAQPSCTGECLLKKKGKKEKRELANWIKQELKKHTDLIIPRVCLGKVNIQ